MPVVCVHRGSRLQLNFAGTQTIAANGSFNLNGYMTFVLDPTVYTAPGRYVLVDYSAPNADFTWAGGYATGQLALNEYALVDDSELVNLSAGLPVDDTANNRITVDVT